MLNNNQAVLKRLSANMLKASKKRNIVAIVAIVLTTFMISSVFSVGVSFIKNFDVMSQRISGTRANVSVSDISSDKLEQIRSMAGVKDVGLMYNVGTWQEENSNNIGIFLQSLDNVAFEKLIAPVYKEVVGSYPSAEYEAMMSLTALRQLGIKEPKVGQQIKLDYKSKGYDFSDTFTLTGYFDSYTNSQSWGTIYLSENYVKTHGLTLERDGTVLVHASNLRKEAVHLKMIELSNFSKDSDNRLIVDSSQKFAEIAVIVMLVLFVVLSGYLLIYNIMYISVTREINAYGMLKTIGATKSQLGKLVYKQARYLMLWGILVGVGLSVLASFVLVPSIMKWMVEGGNPIMPTDVSFSPIIYVGTVLFSSFTVLISCYKPAKLASKVSAVEALKYTSVSVSTKKKSNTVDGAKLYKMSFRNIFRDKKRAILVFLSLSLGVITFIATNNFFSSMDLENYINRYYPWDFKYESVPPLETNTYSNEVLKKLEKLDSLTDLEVISTAYCTFDADLSALKPIFYQDYLDQKNNLNISFEVFLDALVNGSSDLKYGSWLYVIDDHYLSVFEDKYKQKVDIEAFKRGELCILGYGDYDQMVGRSLSLAMDEGKVNASIKVGGAFKDHDDCNAGGYSRMTGCPAAIYVSQAFVDKYQVPKAVSKIQFNVEQGEELSVKQMLEDLNKTLPPNAFMFSSQVERSEEFSSSISVFKVLSGCFAFGFILIGIINFINVMATGIFARSGEFAMLESVGMTKAQITKMLFFEGFYYALLTSALILVFGSAVVGVLAKLTPLIADYAQVVYPFATFGLSFIVIFAVCLSIPAIVYRSVSKETVTERLRAIQ